MPGDISQLTNLGQTLGRIGDQHVGLDGENRISAGSSNWLGRAVNWVKSALGLGDGGTSRVMEHVVGKIRDTEGMGDRFAEIARGRLGSALSRGTPITGRQVSQVISDLVRTKESEDTVKAETIKLNTRQLCESLCDTGDETMLMKALNAQMERYGVGDKVHLVEYADVLELGEKVRTSLEKSSLRKGASPTPQDAQPVITEACRRFAMNKVHEAIGERVQTLAGHDGEESPLMKTVMDRAGKAGIELDIKPGDLAKLADKFKDKLTVRCLYDVDNLHQPTLQESTKTLGKLVDTFLDGMKMVESRDDLSEGQRDAVKKTLVSSPSLFTMAMVEALCDTVKASESVATILTDPTSTREQVAEAVQVFNEVCNEALYAEHSDKFSLLKDGIGGAPESEAVRTSSISVGLELAGIKGETAQKTFHTMIALDSPLTALRYELDSKDQGQRSIALDKMAILRFIGEVGKRAGVDASYVDKSLGKVGPGGVSLDHMRAKLGEGVHGMGGVTVEEGFGKGTALALFETNITEDMGIVDSDPLELVKSGAPKSLTDKAAHFSTGFLKDFFRNGIVVDGEGIASTGTNNYAKMEKALDSLIAKFPSAQEAGRVTRPLFQSVGASIMIALTSDPVTSEAMVGTSTSMGEKLSDALQFSITSKGGGSYDVKAEFGLQRSGRDNEGKKADPLGVTARLDLSISGANQGSGNPVVNVSDFDFVFGRM